MLRLVCLLLIAVAGAAGAGPLEIFGTAISQEEGGAPLPTGFTHVPGETLFFSFRVQGYQASPDQKMRLHYRLDVFDPQGVRVVETVKAVLEAELAPQDKDWKPKVRAEISLPSLAPSGTYKIAVEVTDELARSKAAKEVAFEVRGREVAPSNSLVIRNFHFYRSEYATEPLAKAAYRPGDTLWARFDITGYKFGPENKLDVGYGIAVLNAAGKQLWSQAEAAVERSQSFYPKHYVPGSMSLNLQPSIRPGEYAIVVMVKDAIGEQSYQTRQTFTVE